MKKFLNSLMGVMLIIGIIMTAMTFSDAMAVLFGNKVNLNESVKSDFDEAGTIEGEIYYVYDQIAVEEVTRTKFGVETGSTKTYYYLVESFDKEWFADESPAYEPITFIYATADEDEVKTLDKMVDEWLEFDEAYYEWAMSENPTADTFPAGPDEVLQISGVISEVEDNDIIKYRDEYLGDYVTEDVDTYVSDYCAVMMVENRSLGATKWIFFGGVAIIVLGLVGLIIAIIKNKKSKKNPPEDEINENPIIEDEVSENSSVENSIIDETPDGPINE